MSLTFPEHTLDCYRKQLNNPHVNFGWHAVYGCFALSGVAIDEAGGGRRLYQMLL